MSGASPNQGLSFPFLFDRRSGGPRVSSSTSDDHEHIKESIRQILGTRIGERLMRPDFGSRLHELVFEGNDAVLRGLIRHHVVDAIRLWEKRILIVDVSFDDSDNNKNRDYNLIEIVYRIVESEHTDSLEFTFNR